MTVSVLILGLGASGTAAARYCLERGDRFAPVRVVDTSAGDRLQDTAEVLRQLGATVSLGSDAIEGRYDLCIASPGIPPHAAVMRAALDAADEVISEIEFAYRESSNPWVAVTGTNGKTTTTALVEHLLTVGGISARAVGNIGAPAIEAVGDGHRDEVLVAEVSSFQLALTKRFHPRVAVLLNLTPDHLDWHGSLERYAEDKARVFANLGPDDTAIIDVDDSGAAAYVEPVAVTAARVVTVSVSGDATASAESGTLTLSNNGAQIVLVTSDELLIRGPHNVSNALAAAAAAHALGVHAGDIARGLTTFAPIEHRLEPAGVACGAEWFNDSKATNPDAVSKAIAAFSDRSFVLLLGGRNKGNDFRPLAKEAAAAARAVVVFGEAGDEIAGAFDVDGFQVIKAAGLESAVGEAARIARVGDAVVLSPACASFDEFDNYEQRGRRFKELVASLDECQS